MKFLIDSIHRIDPLLHQLTRHDISSTASMSNDKIITVTYQDRVAIVTLNRPDKLNALSGDLYYLLGERLREIDQRDDIYITVLTGTGRFFSAYDPTNPHPLP